MSGTCTSDTLMGLAGEAANGVYSAANLKDPLNPDWDEDPAMVEYLETIRQYQPDGFRPDERHRGLRLHAGRGLRRGAGGRRGADPAGPDGGDAQPRRRREVGLLLPGVGVATGPDDAYLGEALQLAQYEFIGQGQRNHFVPQGDLVDFEGKTADLTPEGLING